MKRIITLGIAFVMMLVSIGGCTQTTGDSAKRDAWKTEVPSGEKGNSSGTGGSGFGGGR
jgi:hypothetical protein